MLFSQIKPMLLQMGKQSEIIDSSSWTFDTKLDGWRILIHKSSKKTEAFTRQGTNVTLKFPELEEVNKAIKSQTAIIDCEGIVFRKGNSNFSDFSFRGLLNNKDKIKNATISHPVTFVAFDVLFTDGKLHIDEPLYKRKELLNTIIEPNNQLAIMPSVIGKGRHLFEFTKARNMEGIVGKRSDSKYEIDTRSDAWKKYKHYKIGTAVILGYKNSPFQMIVGTLSKGKTRPVATLEFGFSPDEKAAFRQIAKQIIVTKDREIYWLEPRLCCNVQYLEKTEKGHLRIASFKGFNFETDPKSCVTI